MLSNNALVTDACAAALRASCAARHNADVRLHMRRVVANNALVAIGALVPLLALDYLSVRLGQNAAWLRWLGGAALLFPPLGFFRASWPLIGSAPKVKQVFALTVFALLTSVLWFLLVAWAVIGNFHMAIGGRL